ncbi:hypothetical protein [Pseudarthrobacter sp. fls2-241-R2A-127]|uniref:hypothetical protein n=1 Tax=Pseudarthrobacter sp. fls2-241-R2A-127 TaxID=3040303 RepID=UPI0025528A5E|nr:hypothetical protein [Pseudarthrobacter sp. fls2-241-R2A-127]
MSTVDFSTMGAKSAFGGSLLNSWSAALVESPNIRRIRLEAKDMLVPLGEIAPPYSGIPTRAVKFFCVTEISDEEALLQAQLRTSRDRQRVALVEDGGGARHLLERTSLQKLIRNPKKVEARLVITADDDLPSRLFSVTDSIEELSSNRLRHTLKYIEYGESTDFKASGRRAGGAISGRAQASSRKNWYAVPSQPAPPGRIVWVKGRGQVHYVTEIPEGVQVPDNFLVSRPPSGLTNPRALAAIANLSWTHLMVEQFGRRAGGDGVLQTYIRELMMLPILNPLVLSGDETKDLVAAFDEISGRPAMSVTQELQEVNRQNFDRLGLQLMLRRDDVTEVLQDVHQALIALAEERIVKASEGRKVQEASRARQAFDAAPVAESVLRFCSRPPSLIDAGLDIPEGTLDSTIVTVPEHGPVKELATPYDLLDDSSVLINKRIRVETPSHIHATLVRAHLAVSPDFAGTLILPASEEDALELFNTWDGKFKTWQAGVKKRVGDLVGLSKRMTRTPVVANSFDTVAGLAPGTTLSLTSEW